MTLAEIQAAFQAGILEESVTREATILDLIQDSQLADREILFDVYARAYRLRLTEFVTSDHAALRRHLGETRFGSLVAAYIASAPSRHRNARWYSSNLPEFMRATPPWLDDRRACDLASFERSLADAFDAPDATAITLHDLRQLPPQDQAHVSFRFHPSVALLDLIAGTTNAYEGLTEASSSAEASPNGETALIWRRDGECSYRIVDPDERLALLEARQGKRFSDICTLVAFQANDDAVAARIAGFLVQWLDDGLLIDLSLEIGS